MLNNDTIIVVPARIGSTRLPKKLLEKIGDKTIIEHVIVNLLKIGDDINISTSDKSTQDLRSKIIVATDDDLIAALSESYGVRAVMTSPECPSGSDRVYEAICKIESDSRVNFNYVINLQGDMPFLDASIVLKLAEYLRNYDCDIVTPYVKIGQDIASDPSNVKIVKDIQNNALYFSRSLIPYGANEFLYHVGLYGYKKAALERYVKLQRSSYEKFESLEQLRALENGMSIKLIESSQIPVSIDTREDLEKARKYYDGLVD